MAYFKIARNDLSSSFEVAYPIVFMFLYDRGWQEGRSGQTYENWIFLSIFSCCGPFS